MTEPRRKAYLLGFGVPALDHEPLQAPELDLLQSAQHWPEAFGELLGYLELVLAQRGPSARQQLKQHHAVREHVHLKEASSPRETWRRQFTFGLMQAQTAGGLMRLKVSV